MITPMDAEKAFDKVQNSCMIKTLCKLTVKRNFLCLKKNTCTKPKVNIILNDEKLEASSLNWEQGKDVTLMTAFQYSIGPR